MIARWVAGVVLLFGILLLMLPSRDEESLAKIASASMLMCTKDLREQVAQQLLREEVVSVEFGNNCPDLIGSLEVSELGEMVISGNSHALRMTLSPQVADGQVRWSCHGEPAAAVTKLCKP
ncbi:MAG TPA: hypothetical protein VGE00_00960 [Gammaproteobacteria bacterium]